jgi:hypothetical protein
MTDRGLWVAALLVGGNVRRLMYQSLIWPAVLGDDPRRLGAPLDAEDLKGLANALVDGVVRDAQFGGDLFGAQMLVDQPKAVELTAGETRHALHHRIVRHL